MKYTGKITDEMYRKITVISPDGEREGIWVAIPEPEDQKAYDQGIDKDIEVVICNNIIFMPKPTIGDIITVNGITTVVMSKRITQKGVTLSSVGNKIRSTQVDSVNSSINQLRGKTNELTRTVEETLSKL